MAVGETSGVDGVLGDAEAGKATSTEVRVVRRGMEAERSARRAVWRRCGRMVRDCRAVSFQAS